MNCFLMNAKGYGFIDLVLFAPVLLIVLFVGVDAGGAFLEQASLRNALRDALNDQGVYSEVGSYFDYESGDYALNQQVTNNFVSGLDKKIAENMQRLKNQRLSAHGSQYRIVIKLLTLDIDPANGSLIALAEENSQISNSGNPNLDLENEIKGFPQLSAREFIEHELQEEYQKSPSKYAVYLGTVYSSAASRPNYLPKALLIYAEITGLSSSMNADISKSLLGKLYGFQEQILIPVRTIIS